MEREAKHLLESLGYVVTRAAASKGPWDLIAIHKTHIRLIQMKANRYPPPFEIENLKQIQVPENCSVEVWVRKDGCKQYLITTL